MHIPHVELPDAHVMPAQATDFHSAIVKTAMDSGTLPFDYHPSERLRKQLAATARSRAHHSNLVASTSTAPYSSWSPVALKKVNGISFADLLADVSTVYMSTGTVCTYLEHLCLACLMCCCMCLT